MGSLLWAVSLLLCTCHGSALLEEDGVFVREEGEGLQIVATWSVLVTIQQPKPDWILYRVPSIRTFIKKFESSTENGTILNWHSRLDVIESSIDGYRDSLPPPGSSRPRNTSRRRRGLVDAVSTVGNWLFGFATQEEVDEISQVLVEIHDNQQAVTHSLDSMITVVNKTVEALNKQGRRLQLYEKHLIDVEEAARQLQAVAVRDDMRLSRLESMLMVERVLSELETVFRYWERDCELYLNQQRALERGYLTLDLLGPVQLKDILAQQVTVLSTRALPVHWYYMNVKVELLMWRGSEFVYKADLPTVNEDIYVLYNIVTVPVYTGVNNVWRQVVDLPTKVGWNSRRGGTIKTENCFGSKPIVCPPEVHHRHGKCVTGMLTGRKTDLRQCSMRVFSDARQNMAYKLCPNTYLISARNFSNVRLHCAGKPESQAKVDKVKVYTLEPGCTMETDSWRIIGEHVRSINVDYQREVHTVKGISLGFELNKLADFKRVKKLVAHEPVVINAGDVRGLYVRPPTMPRRTLVVGSSLMSTLFVITMIVVILWICCRRRCKIKPKKGNSKGKGNSKDFCKEIRT